MFTLLLVWEILFLFLNYTKVKKNDISFCNQIYFTVRNLIRVTNRSANSSSQPNKPDTTANLHLK